MGAPRGVQTAHARVRLGVLVVLSLSVLMLPATAPAGAAPDVPPEQELDAISVLPPGQSGFFSAQGQARGKASGNPEDYGPHIDDQRELYWNFGYKSGAFSAAGAPEEPRPGVRIYRDDFGVPSIYADNGRDVWFGAGYAVAQDRLFQRLAEPEQIVDPFAGADQAIQRQVLECLDGGDDVAFRERQLFTLKPDPVDGSELPGEHLD